MDMACIHQGDPDLKSEGVLNIGAFLKNSKKLLVLWDSTYSSRAWCMFELAAFLQSHQSEVNLPIDIKPVVIAPATFAFVVGNIFMLLCEVILPAGGFFRFLRFVYLVPAIVMIHIFHKHWCEAWCLMMCLMHEKGDVDKWTYFLLTFGFQQRLDVSNRCVWEGSRCFWSQRKSGRVLGKFLVRFLNGASFVPTVGCGVRDITHFKILSLF